MKKVLAAMFGVSVVLVCLLALGVTQQSSLNRTLDFRHLLLGLSNFSNLTSGLWRRLPSLRREKMLIYMCTPEQGCAGWSDRQRAFVGVFLLAQVTDRRFGLLLTTPCDVRNFYMPNRYDWTVKKEDLEGRSQRIISPAKNLSTIEDFNQVYPEDVLFAQMHIECFQMIIANPQFKSRLPAWARQRYGAYFHDAWDILMKPTPKVQRRFDRFLESVNFYNRSKPLVGVHVRLGKNPTNPKETTVFNNVSNLEGLWRKVGPYVQNGSQLFLASDSLEVRNMSRRRFGTRHHDTDGVILHVAKQKRDARACQGFEDAILDQLILSYCDVLFRSRGGFSLRASYMNRKVSKMYVMNKGKVTP